MNRILTIFVGLLCVGTFSELSMASGLDLALNYGSRYVSLGGQQISLAKDAYAPFYNPAGMIGIEGGAFAADLTNLGLEYGAPIGGPNQQRMSDITLAPLFYIGGAYHFTDRFAAGIALYPTALQGGSFSNVDYGPGITGKDFGNRLARIELAPSIAFKIVDHVSVGLSWRIGYTRYDKSAGTFSNNPLMASYLNSVVSAWDAKGIKIGALLDNWEGLSAAITYRFQISESLQGNTDVYTAAGVTSLPTHQHIDIPAQLQLGVSYEWIPKTLTTALSYEFTFNDVIDADKPVITGFPPAATATPLYYENGHTIHAGVEYVFHMQSGKNLRTGIGFAWDKQFTQESYPAPALPPASDYYGGAIGAGYEWGRSTYGLALNYGSFLTSRTNQVGYPSITVFPGKYTLDIFLAVLDYQLKF